MHHKLITLALLACCAATGQAATWQSLGPIKNPSAYPNTQSCQYRIVNNFWSDKPVFYPTSHRFYGTSTSRSVQFVFAIDVSSLRSLVSNSVALSRFKSAIDNYNNQLASPKSLYGTVTIGDAPRVGIEVSYADWQGLIQGNGWSVHADELKYYELQELCSQ